MGLASRLHSRRFQRNLLWASSLVFVAAIVTVSVVFFGNTAQSHETPLSDEPAAVFERERQVPLSSDARKVAGRFILTAVARKNLDESYDLTHPDLRQGLSREEWRTGNIPVTPYPTDKLDFASFKVDESYPDRAVLQVALLPEEGAKVRPQIFFIGLRKVGAKWLVDYWIPRGAPPVPDNRES